MNHYYPKQFQPGHTPDVMFIFLSFFSPHSCKDIIDSRANCHICSTSQLYRAFFQCDLILLCNKNTLPLFIPYVVDLNIFGGSLSICKYFYHSFLIAHVALTS